jgi:galactokinase
VIDPDDLARAFEATCERSPRLYRAPGRVNLIGEHTDYNDGFVMPMALDRSTWVAAAPRGDRVLAVRSREFGETTTIDLDNNRRPPAGGQASRHWSNYVRGVAAVVGDSASLVGADLLIASDVPIGAGLSSSAALEVACGYALLDLAGQGDATIDLTRLARACQRAEHEFVGTRCGLMDQMIACYGRADHVLKLDTRSLAREWLPLPRSAGVVVCDTMVAHELASAEYNARRADCEAGVEALAGAFPAVRALRDATTEQLDAVAAGISIRVYRRCRHVISENARVLQAASALEAGDFQRVGRLMDESHRSLRDDYEVSCAELDVMVTIARALDGVYGARMTGGGFGGCVVALVENSATERVQARIRARYETETGRRPEVWVCAAGPGVGRHPGSNFSPGRGTTHAELESA